MVFGFWGLGFGCLRVWGLDGVQRLGFLACKIGVIHFFGDGLRRTQNSSVVAAKHIISIYGMWSGREGGPKQTPNPKTLKP